MAGAGPTTGTLAGLWRRATALFRKTAERLSPGRTHRRDAGRFDDVLRLLERDARLKAELLDELREATRLGEGVLVNHSSQIDLAELLRSTTESLAVVGREQDVSLHVRCAAASVIILADPVNLTRAVSRLLASAIDSSAGGTTIDCELSVTADWTRLAIRTTGSEAAVARIPRGLDSVSPDPSVRNSAAWDQLGLAVVRASVHAAGGIVRVDRQDRQLTFTLSIPGDRRRTSRDQP